MSLDLLPPTQQQSSQLSQTPFPFLDLPDLVRDEVYKFFIGNRVLVDRGFHDSRSGHMWAVWDWAGESLKPRRPIRDTSYECLAGYNGHPQLRGDLPEPGPISDVFNLVLTCHQIHDESLKFIYRHCTLKITKAGEVKHMVDRFPLLADRITHVHFDYHSVQQAGFRLSISPGQAFSDPRVQLFVEVFAELKKLAKITLREDVFVGHDSPLDAFFSRPTFFEMRRQCISGSVLLCLTESLAVGREIELEVVMKDRGIDYLHCGTILGARPALDN